MKLIKNTILGGVYGLALGDAVGVPYEFMSRETVKQYDLSVMRGYGTHNQPIGTFSDDTSMVLATLDALNMNVSGLGAVMDNFKAWLKSGKYTANGVVFDVGGTTYRAIERYCAGENVENCGEADELSNGNGSLMRMLPVVYYLWATNRYDIDDDTVNLIYSFSELTHAHILSKMCCVYYVSVALRIILAGSVEGLDKAIESGIAVADEYYRNIEGISLLGDYYRISNLREVLEFNEDEIKSSGYVLDSLEASLWCVYNSTTFEEAVCRAVSLGSDTDTVGAITGSLAGIYYGFEALPKEWVINLKNKSPIYDICDKFYSKYK